tara:strand:- start:3466 stop:4752 length:1287 start_codon:yes stop_codon:yes gene_type:complete
MPDLREKLRRTVHRDSTANSTVVDGLRRLYNRGKTKQFADDSFSRTARYIHEYVDGEYINTAFGDIFVTTTNYARQHKHGAVAMNSLPIVKGNLLHRWGRVSEAKHFDLKRTIFMDMETSGLAGGGGTIPFLIGIGIFDRGCFQVRQFFADVPAVEEGMLNLVDEFVKPAETLITFNGKSFDVPQLETRYHLKRRRSPFADLDHIDLLYPSRQLWSGELSDCQLQTLESNILGFERGDDLPGSEVPEAYFRFLRRGDADPLYRVFQHNADDITSLAALTVHLWQSLTNPGQNGRSGTPMAHGRIHLRLGNRMKAGQSFRNAMKDAISNQVRIRAALDLSMVYKSEKRWRDAEKLWRHVIEKTHHFHLLPYIELAKYLEHKAKGFEEATSVVEKAIDRLPSHRLKDRDALEHRLKRLQIRMTKEKASRS